MEKNKINFLKMELENELKKDWRKFQLNDFDIYTSKSEIKILFRRKDFMAFDYSQNPVSKIIRIK